MFLPRTRIPLWPCTKPLTNPHRMPHHCKSLSARWARCNICNTLQHWMPYHCKSFPAKWARCNTLPNSATLNAWPLQVSISEMSLPQHTAKQCNTECLTIVSLFQEMSPLQHTPTHSNTLQHTATLNIASLLQRDEPSATHCSTLQHTATHCNTERLTIASLFQRDEPVATHCNTLQHRMPYHCKSLSARWAR